MTRKLTVADAARELGVSESTVRRRLRRGDLPSLRLVEGGRDRTWVLLDEAAEAVPVSTVTTLAIVRPALAPGRGWCLRHRHSYEWLKSWGRDFEFTARFADAFWFASLDGARRAGRDLSLQLEAVEVARVRAAAQSEERTRLRRGCPAHTPLARGASASRPQDRRDVSTGQWLV